MVTAVAAACAAVLACGLIFIWLQRARRRTDERFEEILRQLDGHLASMSQSVARAVEAVTESGAQRSLPPLTLDFDELVDALVAETAARTGADAVVLRVEGPGGRPVVSSVGAGVESETLDRSFGPPTEIPFDSAAIDWTFSAGAEPEDVRFQSARHMRSRLTRSGRSTWPPSGISCAMQPSRSRTPAASRRSKRA